VYKRQVFKPNLAGGGQVEPCQQGEQGALSAAGFSYDGVDRTLLKGAIDVFYCFNPHIPAAVKIRNIP
jgi:hypothetical protein